MERLLNGPLLKAIRDVVATIRAVLFLGAPLLVGNGFFAYLVGSHINSKRALEGIAFVAASLVAGVGLAGCYYIRNVNDPAPYRVVEMEGMLTIEPIEGHPCHRYILERKEIVAATRNNLRLIEHRTHWTGGGAKSLCEARSLSADHELFVGSRAEEDGRRRLWVYLGEPLGKGETAQVGTREVYVDDVESMKPYHRKGCGRFKARNLTVVTRFAASEDPRDVEGLIWNDDRKVRERAIVGTVGFKRIPHPDSGTVDYVVAVPRPKRYHSYGIRWKNPNGYS
jgi:hypothetical protein